jgi:hypothetical protein
VPGDSGKANASNAVAQYTIEMMKAPLLRRAALKIQEETDHTVKAKLHRIQKFNIAFSFSDFLYCLFSKS